MSKKVLDRLAAEFGDRILSTSNFRGDEAAEVARKDWKAVATFLRDDDGCSMNQFVDLTAVDYPEREPEEPRFEVLLSLRSMKHGFRIRLKAKLGDGEDVGSVVSLWRGADWAEREVFDMFGIRFAEHPDLRRILMYEEFEGYPLRKDYPIDKAQPLVPYREVAGTDKLPPFGADEGQPWGRIDWQARLAGDDQQVSPAIGQQVGQRPSLSSGKENVREVAAPPEELAPPAGD